MNIIFALRRNCLLLIYIVRMLATGDANVVRMVHKKECCVNAKSWILLLLSTFFRHVVREKKHDFFARVVNKKSHYILCYYQGGNIIRPYFFHIDFPFRLLLPRNTRLLKVKTSSVQSLSLISLFPPASI